MGHIIMRVLLFVGLFACACVAAPLENEASDLAIPSQGIRIHPPRAKDTSFEGIQWSSVAPNVDLDGMLSQVRDQELLQEDEGAVSVEVSTLPALTCSESGCTCKHQYYSNHLDTKDCEVFVPSQYHSSNFRCQYFVQGGYLFLYGGSWLKANIPS